MMSNTQESDDVLTTMACYTIHLINSQPKTPSVADIHGAWNVPLLVYAILDAGVGVDDLSNVFRKMAETAVKLINSQPRTPSVEQLVAAWKDGTDAIETQLPNGAVEIRLSQPTERRPMAWQEFAANRKKLAEYPRTPEPLFNDDVLTGDFWRLIDEHTPKDRMILVFAPGDDPEFHETLPDLVSLCKWHPDAGFCVDELRQATHWMPYERPNVHDWRALGSQLHGLGCRLFRKYQSQRPRGFGSGIRYPNND